MKKAFHVVCSQGASFLTKEDRQALATEVAQMAEKMKPGDHYCLFTDDERDLKVLVNLEGRQIWIMAKHEAPPDGSPSRN